GAGHERVEGVLVRVGIAHQAAAGADALEAVVTAGNQLVRIDLMARVPDEAVAAEVEGQVQGEAQLDDAEIAGEVSRTDAENAHPLIAQLLSELHQLLIREPLQVGRGSNRWEDRAAHP